MFYLEILSILYCLGELGDFSNETTWIILALRQDNPLQELLFPGDFWNHSSSGNVSEYIQIPKDTIKNI